MKPCLVAFHAHPDDEAIFTGGTIIRAKRAGWRVVVVVATSGERGSKPEWVAGDLAAHRRSETEVAARLLGADKVVFLGYGDSGIAPRADPASRSVSVVPATALARASVLEAAARLRRLLFEERATVLTSYDEAGIYGHEDHIRVHAIAAAAVLDTTCDLVEATIDRALLRSLRADLVGRGLDPAVWPARLVEEVGTGDGRSLLTLDLHDGLDLDRKLEAVAAHASQVVEAQDFMGLPPGAFHRLMAYESFRPARLLDGRFCELVSSGSSPERSPATAGAASI